MTKLSKRIIADKKHSLKHKRHRNLDKEYKALRKEIAELKKKKNVRHHHILKVHKKVKSLHKKAIKEDHPILRKAVQDIDTVLTNFGNWAKTKYAEYEDKRKYAKSHEQELLMKKKLEESRKAQMQNIVTKDVPETKNINYEDIRG
jgi:hypothetical protein